MAYTELEKARTLDNVEAALICLRSVKDPLIDCTEVGISVRFKLVKTPASHIQGFLNDFVSARSINTAFGRGVSTSVAPCVPKC